MMVLYSVHVRKCRFHSLLPNPAWSESIFYQINGFISQKRYVVAANYVILLTLNEIICLINILPEDNKTVTLPASTLPFSNRDETIYLVRYGFRP